MRLDRLPWIVRGAVAAGVVEAVRHPPEQSADEPTTGLHSSDTERLLTVLHSLVDKGHTVIAVTHSLEVIRTADWVIDIGPDGGDRGGRLVAAGTPEEVAGSGGHTGRFLREAMEARAAAELAEAPGAAA